MLLDNTLLDSITEQAKKSSRLRMHYNLHESLDAKAQRLFVALEPGTPLPIHRHRGTNETQMIVRGHIKALFYNDNREVIEEYDLNPAEGRYGVHIPAGTWHTLEVLESGSVILEVKDGPYIPSAPEDVME